jgi:2-oxoglutarate-dependent dioxygenase
MQATTTAELNAFVKETRLSAQQITSYKEEGYVLLPGLITRDEAARLRREVMNIMDVIGLPMTKLKQTSEYLEGSELDTFVNSPHLKSIAGQLMEGPSTLYLPFTAVKSGGGGDRFHFHQDNNYTRFDGPGINLWFALEEMRVNNGCLQIVPRSHLNGTAESVVAANDDRHRMVKWEPKDFVTVNMQPGDCVAFSRLTVHGSGKNDSSQPRVAYAVQFHRNDVKWLDRESDSWKLLLENPRWHAKRVKTLTVPKGKIDGH